MTHLLWRVARTGIALAATALLGAQEPVSPPRPVDAVAVRSQALIDVFIGAMPKEPVLLREAAVRKRLAPQVLPVLRDIRAFAAEHPDCAFGARVQEFTVYALVLGEPGLRESLLQRQREGDAAAGFLLAAADTIVADDKGPRADAVAAFAKLLRVRDEAADQAPTAVAARCAVFTVVIAAGLTEAEAKGLADSTKDPELGQSLRSRAEAAARDPRRLLDQPFELAGELPDGTRFTTKSLLGKVVLVDFWATWCAPCRKALPELVRTKQQHAAAGLAVVAVDCDKDRGKLTAFLAEHPEVDWPQLVAEGDWHPVATALGVTAIPRLFLIDRKGVLRSVDAATDLDGLVQRYLAQ